MNTISVIFFNRAFGSPVFSCTFMVHSFNCSAILTKSNHMAKKKNETDVAYDYQAGKDERLKAILEKAGAAIDAEKVEYFLGVVHLQPENEDGGKVHVQHELKPATLLYLLDAAEPTREDLVRIGMWVGQRLNATK